MSVEVSVDPFGLDWTEQLKAEVRRFVAAWDAADHRGIADAAERLRGFVVLLDDEDEHGR